MAKKKNLDDLELKQRDESDDRIEFFSTRSAMKLYSDRIDEALDSQVSKPITGVLFAIIGALIIALAIIAYDKFISIEGDIKELQKTQSKLETNVSETVNLKLRLLEQRFGVLEKSLDKLEGEDKNGK